MTSVSRPIFKKSMTLTLIGAEPVVSSLILPPMTLCSYHPQTVKKPLARVVE